MSHIAKVETMIRDLDALKAACKQLGFEFVEGQKTYAWFGRWVGDSKMPEGLKVEDLGKCDHAIRVPGAKYEVGVVRKEAGSQMVRTDAGHLVEDTFPAHYELRWDYWKSGGLMDKLGGQKAGKLMQSYAVEKTKREASRRGQVVKAQTLSDGSVKLTLQGGASW